MTIFISQGFDYTHQICGELRVPRATRRGAEVDELVVPYLEAAFKNRPIEPWMAQQATLKFRQKLGRRFADAYEFTEGYLSDTSSLEPGDDGFHQPFRPELRFGIFDTRNRGVNPQENDVVPWKGRYVVPDWREIDTDIDVSDLYERELYSSPFFGTMFVEITAERLAAPWPTYDADSGGGVHDRIASMVKAGGFDPTYVIAYEKQRSDGGRPGVIKKLEDILREKVAEREARGAFQTQVAVGDRDERDDYVVVLEDE